MSAGKLPEGWVECELSELGNIVTGKTPSTKEPSNFGGNIPFIKPGDLDLGGYIMNTADTLTEKGLSLVPTLPANSVVVTCIGNLGKVGITVKKSASNQQINALIPSEKLNVKFVYYQILTLKPWLESQSAATTIAIVNKSKFSQAPFKFPPLAEQKIIAEKLDTLLAQVESTKARLEQIPQILKRFRQAVLAIAVNGQLTKEWRELSELSAIWPSLTLGELVTIERGSSPRPIKDYITASESGVNWIKIGDAREGEKYIHSTKEKITPEGAKKSRKVTPGDFILSNSMSLGRAYIVDIEGYVHDGWFILRLPQHIDKNYFYYLLSSSQLQEQFSNLAVGGVVQNIRSELVKQAIVNIPSEKEQHEIVRRVEQLFAYADTIEKQVNNALARVNNLTQSILAKAFRGELTAQWRAENPDLISGENSAAALLEKIKAERAASGGKKASRKKS
ncbi:TPA: restriction endonuclease subunit S [Escherichia fergusonii]|uniref:restriction endonuclease subunit S n=1 Tax=Escherichia fergusonii TaxID=564 RepID=UPI0001FB6A11|nr:restriction endonuclease subunit S [Escherichia fergusonii]EFL4510768.1 restriction endonuclease subunit S [Escherichia fergusonii]EFL4512901.1 restriction endonuclease subunit S [Escherichia fergusonii]EFN0218368.1 restriction endonuclease subunit S [Escherichia fergusonii]EFO7694392.1 restriction endonuclease subunit S [Escherichia fergusonii]EGC09242.1 type I restriction modification DNA specificity domain-containing protein [Escherichia fergusonii B253]